MAHARTPALAPRGAPFTPRATACARGPGRSPEAEEDARSRGGAARKGAHAEAIAAACENPPQSRAGLDPFVGLPGPPFPGPSRRRPGDSVTPGLCDGPGTTQFAQFRIKTADKDPFHFWLHPNPVSARISADWNYRIGIYHDSGTDKYEPDHRMVHISGTRFQSSQSGSSEAPRS